MPSLDWHDSAPAPTHRAPASVNPWLGVAMGLLGVIVGYALTSLFLLR